MNIKLNIVLVETLFALLLFWLPLVLGHTRDLVWVEISILGLVNSGLDWFPDQ